MSLKEQAELHQGIADATRMVAGENDSKETTAIVLTMVIFWRLVDRLPTARSLLDMLTKAHGENIVGDDPKRIAQICARIGKKFRGPGRPRKQLQRRAAVK
jgi:hypothetical protein